MRDTVLIVHAEHRLWKRVAVNSEVGVGLILQYWYAIRLRDLHHMFPAVSAQCHSHRVLVHADCVNQLGTRALCHKVLYCLFEGVGVHAVGVTSNVDDIGALPKKHPQGA